MLDRLFVYGTLMRSAAAAPLGRSMRTRLEAEAEWVGTGKVAGRLYDFGRYPGLVRTIPLSQSVVHGEVFRLLDPVSSFRWLDLYEGLPVGLTRGAEYERVVGSVAVASGTSTNAWVYVWIGSLDRARLVGNGRWRSDGG